MPALFRRREAWLPTLWGGLLLGCGAVALLFLLGRASVGYLSVRAPAHGPDGHGARTLVVEGWLERAELEQAIVFFRSGRYERVLTTGAPLEEWDGAPRWASFAERAADYLRSHGIASVPVVAVPAPASAQDRTFLSAVMVREWAQRNGIALDAIDVYSAGVHARRSRVLFRMALGPTVEVGMIAAQPRGYDAARWWTSSGAAKSVLGEALSLAWTTCCFWPAAPGTHEERWAVPPSAAQ